MKKNKRLIRLFSTVFTVLFVFLMIGASSIAWMNSPSKNIALIDILNADEIYEYEVRYGFLRLGNVIVTVSDTLYHDQPHFLIAATLYSNSNLPFIGYKEYNYNSIVQLKDSILYTPYFWVDKVHRDIYPFNSYTFDYENNVVYSFEHPSKRDTLEINEITFGGPELLLFSRIHSGTQSNHLYQVAIDNQISTVNVQYTTETETMRSPFNGRRIKVLRTNGFADLNGPFGFSGAFQGFNTDDDLRLPIETKLNVWIGNTTIRMTGFESNR